MTLPEVFKLEGIPVAMADAMVFGRCGGGRTIPIEPDWTKSADGCWYAEGLKFIPAIAKLGDLEGAFEPVGRKRPTTQS
jgi:hypothetical protein